MKITQEFVVARPPQDVWEFFQDIPSVAECLPGANLAGKGDDGSYDGTLAVKRAVERRGPGWWLLSDNPDEGVDSRHRGPVPGDRVLAVALARVWPRPRRL